MKVKIAKTTGTLFEYFLYAALILETGLAAFIFTVVSGQTELFRLRIYLAIFYFGFLAWGISQLNKLHRARRQFQTTIEAEPIQAEPEAAPPEIDAAAPVTKNAEPPRLVLGLTGAQLMVVLVVFLTALVTFNWAWSALHLGRQ